MLGSGKVKNKHTERSIAPTQIIAKEHSTQLFENSLSLQTPDKVYSLGLKELSDVSESQGKENLSKNGKD